MFKKKLILTGREPLVRYLRNIFCSTTVILTLIIALSACGIVSNRVVGTTLVSKEYGFRLDLPDNDFEAKHTKDIPLILFNPKTGSTITVTVSEDRYHLENYSKKKKEIGLRHIARGLFFYVKEKKYLKSHAATLGGLDAWYLELSGEVSDVPLIFSVYVVRHDKKIYDLTLFAPPGDFEKSYETFNEIMLSFEFTGGSDK